MSSNAFHLLSRASSYTSSAGRPSSADRPSSASRPSSAGLLDSASRPSSADLLDSASRPGSAGLLSPATRPNSAGIPDSGTRPSSATRRRAMTGDTSQLQRSLMAAFNAVADEVSTALRRLQDADAVNSWPLSGSNSGFTSPRSEASDDAVTRLVHAYHDEMQQGLSDLYPDSVQAVAHVVADIFSRTDQPRAANSREHTPLGRDQVEELGANFMDRLLVLTLARRLPQLVQRHHTGLTYFEVEEATPHLVKARALAQALVQDLCATGEAALWGGSARAPRNALAAVVQNVQDGLETHSWDDDEPRYAALGNTLIAAVSQIDRPQRAAMVHAAIDWFNQTQAIRPTTPATPATPATP